MQNVEFRRQKQFNWDALRDWALGLFNGFTDYSDSLDAKMTDFNNRFDDQMSAATDGDKDLSEVVDARRPNQSPNAYTNTCIYAPLNWFDSRFDSSLSKFKWADAISNSSRPPSFDCWKFTDTWNGEKVDTSYGYESIFV